MTIIAGEPPRKPLPVVARTIRDELLSSWISRCAQVYGVSANDLLRHMGIGVDPRQGISSATLARAVDFRPSLPVRRRIAWCMHSTSAAIAKRSHPVTMIGVRDARFIKVNGQSQPCAPCQSRFTRRGLATVQLRSWLEPWRRLCGGCNRPLHTAFRAAASKKGASPTRVIPAALWRDALAGGAIIEHWLTGRSCGLLPPDMVVKIFKILAPPLSQRPARLRNSKVLTLLVSQAAQAAFKPKLMRSDLDGSTPHQRLVILAGIARFNGDPAGWMHRVEGSTTPAGRAVCADIKASLPAIIADQLWPAHNQKPIDDHSTRHGALTVAAHQLSLKLAANLRQLDEICLKLRAFAAQQHRESQI